MFLAAVAAVCADASGGPDWQVVANRIGCSIPWEFDDRYDAEVDEGQAERKRRRASTDARRRRIGEHAAVTVSVVSALVLLSIAATGLLLSRLERRRDAR